MQKLHDLREQIVTSDGHGIGMPRIGNFDQATRYWKRRSQPLHFMAHDECVYVAMNNHHGTANVSGGLERPRPRERDARQLPRAG